MSQEDYNSGANMGSAFATIILTILFALLLWGCWESWELDAVKHGKAQYVMDPITGKTHWEWKP